MTSSEPEKALDVLLSNIQTKNSWNPDAVLKEALKERAKLLEEHPELSELQEELDRCLENVDDFEGRMKIIGRMIGNRLNRLSDHCDELEDLLKDVGIHTELPISTFKKSLVSRTFLLDDDGEDKK